VGGGGETQIKIPVQGKQEKLIKKRGGGGLLNHRHKNGLTAHPHANSYTAVRVDRWVVPVFN